jgi:cytochrome c oxidase subunit 2
MSAPWRRLAESYLSAGLSTAALFFTGCDGIQSALDPASPQAARISDLWWMMFALCTAVLLAVIGFLLYRVLYARRWDGAVAEEETDRRMTIGVAGVAAVTVVTVFVLLVASISTGRGLSLLSTPEAVNIEVIGHQWWWEVHYIAPAPNQHVITANEIHIPVGQTVVLTLKSRDVIHSFWVPNLHGKRDLIPGHVTTLAFQADKPGLFRGQCAEFCGYQHAHMAFLVVAEPAEQFAAWLEGQRHPAVQPDNVLHQRG